MKVTRIFIHNFWRINLEFPWNFHVAILPNINILQSSTKLFKNFKNFLKISVMFSAVLLKFVEKLPTIFFFGFSSIFWNIIGITYFKIFTFCSNIFSKFPHIFSKFSCIGKYRYLSILIDNCPWSINTSHHYSRILGLCSV